MDSAAAFTVWAWSKARPLAALLPETLLFTKSNDSRLRARQSLTVLHAAASHGVICFTKGICLNVFNILSYIPAPRYIVLPSI